uniref:Uncharacterized protein n=1 Tax=Candidatus Kentrum sp. TUN TaxID=2126343 RepID=A0A450ZD33_9GAMM|nr:MAG: hypothetical protein BECKTUN1418D_GA0071000_101014 [Candidatus Kentron sp. TUN]
MGIRHHIPPATYPGAARATPGYPHKSGNRPPYLVLLQVGFTLPPRLPEARCALTAPFHPYPPISLAGKRQEKNHGRYIFCGTFRGFTSPRRYLAPRPMEPGLSSIPTPNLVQQSPSDTATAQSTPAGIVLIISIRSCKSTLQAPAINA